MEDQDICREIDVPCGTFEISNKGRRSWAAEASKTSGREWKAMSYKLRSVKREACRFNVVLYLDLARWCRQGVGEGGIARYTRYRLASVLMVRQATVQDVKGGRGRESL